MSRTEEFLSYLADSWDILSGPLSALLSIVPVLIVLFLGWFIGWGLKCLIQKFFRSVSFVDESFTKIGLGDVLSRVGLRVDIGKFIGVVVEVFVIVFALVLSFDLLGLDQVNQFLVSSVLTYLPNVVVATFIVIAGVLIAGFAEKMLVGTTRLARLGGGFHGGKVAKYAVLVFTALIALGQLGVATSIVESIVVGIIAAMSLALGLAFGLGGQATAAEYLRRLEEESRR